MSPRVISRTIGALVVATAVYYVVWGGEYSALDLLRIEERQEEARLRLAEARVEVDSLRALATALERDPATIEAVARERFGMIRKGELLYRFVSDAEAPRAAEAAAPK